MLHPIACFQILHYLALALAPGPPVALYQSQAVVVVGGVVQVLNHFLLQLGLNAPQPVGLLLLGGLPQVAGDEVDLVGDFGVDELLARELSDGSEHLLIKNKPTLLYLIDEPLQGLLHIFYLPPVQPVLALVEPLLVLGRVHLLDLIA